MKKLFYIFIVFLFMQSSTIANYNDIYIADIQYDWIKKKDVEKEALITEVHDIILEKSIDVKKNLKDSLKDKIKDKDRLKHYMAASAGYKESDDYVISAFYYKNQKHIYMYALQEKKDLFFFFFVLYNIFTI